MANQPMDSPSGSNCSSPIIEQELELDKDTTCSFCEETYKQPRLLSCLHRFCTPCLEKQIQKDAEDNGTSLPTESLLCFECKQETKLGPLGVRDLSLDTVLNNKLDTSSKDELQILCTSCKAQEKAVARCKDCANFLCSNCVTAHRFMRCFENHEVVTFDDADNGSLCLEKPLYCSTHPAEPLKFFCYTTQTLVCQDCMQTEPKPPDHSCDRIDSIDAGSVKEELKALVVESSSKTKHCEEAMSALENALSELQMQRDNARSNIQETFQSYKAVLEKKKDDLLQELEDIHSKQELAVMDHLDTVTKTMERIEDGCKFTEDLLANATLTEILSVKKLVSSQLLSLINNTPKVDATVNITFNTDSERFEEAVGKEFGSFIKEESKSQQETQLPSLQSSFENENALLPPGMLASEPMLPSVPVSEFIPASLAPLSIGSTSLANMPVVPPISSIAPGIMGVTEPHPRSLSRNSHSPAASDSGVSVDGPGSGSNTPQLNLAELAKSGNLGVNNQGQITLNGQVIQGLNINNMPGISQPQRTPGISTSTGEPALASLLGGTSMPPTVPPTQAPHIDLAGLLGSSLNVSVPTTPTAPGLNGPLTPGGSSTSGLPSAGSSCRGSGRTNAMQIRYRCKFGQLGPGKGQFNSPHGFCLGLEEDIVVADTNNHRVQVFEKTGEFKYQFGIPGREEGQLWYPRKVAVMRHSGKYVVCDRGNERSRMQIFTKSGHFIKKIAIRYIDIVAGLAITTQGHIVAVDSVSPTVFVIAESGDLVKWFDCSDYMREPSDIAINSKEYFVCDFKGHCVVVFNEDGQFLRRIGCENITNFPNGIDISDAGDVLVGDSHGNRFHVAVFQRDGSLIGEFECPYVKVSRCCGLKITSEGYIVTLAKNNHHVLVLHTLYIT